MKHNEQRVACWCHHLHQHLLLDSVFKTYSFFWILMCEYKLRSVQCNNVIIFKTALVCKPATRLDCKKGPITLHGAMLGHEKGGAETVQQADKQRSRSTKLRPCEKESPLQEDAAYPSNDHKLLREAENKPCGDRRPQEGKLTNGRRDFKWR